MATLNFNANDVDPNVSFDPIPAGKYLAVITDSQMKPTRNGTGEYLQLQFEVVDGQYKGRKVWERLTLKHSNETTVKIARGNLSAVCRAIGVMAPKDSIELHNVPLVINVACKKRDDNGELTNAIKGFEKREAATASRAFTTAGAAGSPPPWKR